MPGPFYRSSGDIVVDGYYKYSRWFTSPRVNGELVLRSQAYDMRKHQRLKMQKSREIYSAPYPTSMFPDTVWGWIDPAVQNRARSQFYKELKSESASLGVTLGSWKQSRDMIVGRSRWAHRRLSVIEADARQLARMKFRSRKEKRQAIADFHLEVIFGWQPLFQDIFSALTIVTNPVKGQPFVCRGASQGLIEEKIITGDSPRVDTHITAKSRCCVAGVCEISNPNLFLANQLGLVNPALVAWDLVPWSWVVGMFVNASSLISSVTDDLGVSYKDMSITDTITGVESKIVRYNSPPYPQSQAGSVNAQWTFKYKRRSVGGSPPNPSLVVTVPDLNWGLAATAFSVVTQRVKRLNDILVIPFS